MPGEEVEGTRPAGRGLPSTFHVLPFTFQEHFQDRRTCITGSRNMILCVPRTEIPGSLGSPQRSEKPRRFRSASPSQSGDPAGLRGSRITKSRIWGISETFVFRILSHSGEIGTLPKKPDSCLSGPRGDVSKTQNLGHAGNSSLGSSFRLRPSTFSGVTPFSIP